MADGGRTAEPAVVEDDFGAFQFVGLKHCASKRETEFAVIVLPNTDFDKVVFETAIKRFKGLEKLNDGQYLKFKKIICVHNQEVVYITDGI